eukprot:scaffold14805_cov121-Isochrysis_galbana.AAC.12
MSWSRYASALSPLSVHALALLRLSRVNLSLFRPSASGRPSALRLSRFRDCRRLSSATACSCSSAAARRRQRSGLTRLRSAGGMAPCSLYRPHAASSEPSSGASFAAASQAAAASCGGGGKRG